jgi:hypothetical protein
LLADVLVTAISQVVASMATTFSWSRPSWVKVYR